MPKLLSYKTSQLICSTNQLTDFYMMATLAFDKLVKFWQYVIRNCITIELVHIIHANLSLETMAAKVFNFAEMFFEPVLPNCALDPMIFGKKPFTNTCYLLASISIAEKYPFFVVYV